MKKFIIFLLIISGSMMFAQSKLEKVQAQVEKGNFMNAHEMIENFLDDESLTNNERETLKFENERMERISKDFSKTAADVLKYLDKYFPGITEKDLEKWEKTNKLEYKYINGKKYYFNRADRKSVV